MFWCLQQLHFSDKLHVFGLDACLRVRLPWHTCAMHSSNLMNITCMSPHYYFFSATKRKLWLFHLSCLSLTHALNPHSFPTFQLSFITSIPGLLIKGRTVNTESLWTWGPKSVYVKFFWATADILSSEPSVLRQTFRTLVVHIRRDTFPHDEHIANYWQYCLK